MTYLLDTCSFIWAASDPKRLSPRARRICESRETRLIVSTVSLWEIVVKAGKGLLPIPNPIALLTDWVTQLETEVMPVKASHVYGVHGLPDIHKDPFDRMLVAQSATERIPLLTADEAIRRYGVRCVW